jgi:hypothetical protein
MNDRTRVASVTQYQTNGGGQVFGAYVPQDVFAALKGTLDVGATIAALRSAASALEEGDSNAAAMLAAEAFARIEIHRTY